MVAAMGLASDYCPLYGICWAPFGHAGGAAGLPIDVLCLLVCRFLGKNLAWSSTANDDGTMGIVFFLEGVTVRNLHGQIKVKTNEPTHQLGQQ